MMEHEGPATRNEVAAALHRRVDHLVLSGKTRDRILAGTRHKMSAEAGRRPLLAWAAVACLLFGSIGVFRTRTPPAVHPSSHIKCVSVVYADEARVNWSKRTVMVRMKNGTESYIKVVASRPQATKGKPL
jgi:hypothetical protein